MKRSGDGLAKTARNRKGVFLRESTRDLKNARVLVRRAEAIAASYDWLISRAVLPSELPPLADHAAVLAGTVRNPHYVWGEPIRVPWGRNRFLWLGQNVPRETVSC